MTSCVSPGPKIPSRPFETFSLVYAIFKTRRTRLSSSALVIGGSKNPRISISASATRPHSPLSQISSNFVSSLTTNPLAASVIPSQSSDVSRMNPVIRLFQDRRRASRFSLLFNNYLGRWPQNSSWCPYRLTSSTSSKVMMKEIDGSTLEGGGQLLRNTCSFAALLHQPVTITKIRKNRKPPGLKAQHSAGELIYDTERTL